MNQARHIDTLAAPICEAEGCQHTTPACPLYPTVVLHWRSAFVQVSDDRGEMPGAEVEVLLPDGERLSGTVLAPEGDCIDCWVSAELTDTDLEDTDNYINALAEAGNEGAAGRDGNLAVRLKVTRPLDDTYRGLLIAELLARTPAQYDTLAGSVWIECVGFAVYATPGWEGDWSNLPIDIVTDDGDHLAHGSSEPVEWNGVLEEDVRRWQWRVNRAIRQGEERLETQQRERARRHEATAQLHERIAAANARFDVKPEDAERHADAAAKLRRAAMDPEATLQNLLDAIEDDAHEEAQEYATTLVEWLHGGGFTPKMNSATRRRMLLAVERLERNARR